MNDKRRPGRPPLVDGDTTTSINVRVPSRDYDRVYTLALKNRESMPDVLRRGLAQLLDHESAEDE